MSISVLEGLFEREKSTITVMTSTSRCSSRCPSRCAIHYGYRAWTLPNKCCSSTQRGHRRVLEFLQRSVKVANFQMQHSDLGVSLHCIKPWTCRICVMLCRFRKPQNVGPATTQNLVVKFDGEICGGVLVENASDDFPSKRSSKISLQTSPEVRHQFRRKLRQLHSGNRWCLKMRCNKIGLKRRFCK